MDFRGWLKQSIIYVDFDNTLAYVHEDRVLPRPHVYEFIHAAQQLAPVKILTHGHTDSHQQLADYLKFRLPVIGRDQYHLLPPSPQAILIDNLPPEDPYTRLKLSALDTKRFILVKGWFGGPDNELPHVYQQLQRFFAQHEWIERNPQPKPTKQPFHTYKKAINLAKEQEKKFRQGLKEAALGGQVIVDLKSKRSFLNKTERGKEPEKVFDVLRGAILVDKKNQIQAVVDELKRVFIIKKVEHKTKPEEPFGYYGSVHVDVVVHELVCEVQVMTKKLWTFKEKTDKIYHRYRGKAVPAEVAKKCQDLFKQANQ